MTIYKEMYLLDYYFTLIRNIARQSGITQLTASYSCNNTHNFFARVSRKHKRLQDNCRLADYLRVRDIDYVSVRTSDTLRYTCTNEIRARDDNHREKHGTTPGFTSRVRHYYLLASSSVSKRAILR